MIVQVAESEVRQVAPTASGRGSALVRIALVVLGVALGQSVLYGPSLIGKKILLPLDLLADPGVYLPRTPELAKTVPHDVILSDLVFFYEPERQFAHSEFSAGRFPLWTPHRYAGAPCFRLSFSPAWLLAYSIASPVVLAWTQMLIALIAGLGAYVFFRRILQLGFWPAAIASWCYPLTGSFVIWQGYWQPAVMCWLPWMLLAVDGVVRRPLGWGGPGLAAVTAVALISGAADNAGQLLLASGIYAVWCGLDQYGARKITRRQMTAIGMTGLAWALGILASMWLLLPMIQYVNTGARAMARSQGQEERPPVGLAALPQVVLPEIYGSTHRGSLRITPGNVQESSVGAYAGLLAALLLAPLAFGSRRHRSVNILFVALILIGLSWQLNVPGMVDLLRSPGLKMMSHNRLVFVAAFAILAMAAIGLDALWQGTVSRRRWFALPAIVLLGAGSWSVYRTMVLPEPVATQLGQTIAKGQVYASVRSPADVSRVRLGFIRSSAIGASLAAIGLLVLLRLTFKTPPRIWLPLALGMLMMGELLWFGYGRSAQCDPSLYYPRVPILDKIAQASPGRIAAFNCLPANLGSTHGLLDIRGYDGVDPARFMDLLKPTAAPGSAMLPYALTQWLTPIINIPPTGGCRLWPVFDMLGVRHVVCRGAPPPGVKPDFVDMDYWALENPAALPRVSVPNRVETVRNERDRLNRLLANNFDPRQVAFVEQDLDLPPACRGSAAIVEETPTHIKIALDMRTAGLLLLADRWDAGWNAYLDRKSAPVLRTNHVLRGVVVPEGKRVLEFRYEPGSLRWGAWISVVAALCWMSWVGVTTRAMRGQSPPDPLHPASVSVDLPPRNGARKKKRFVRER